MFGSSSLRLAAVYTVGFALSVILLGATTLYSTRAALSRQFEQRIGAESAALAQEYRIEGLNGVVQAVRERDRTPGALDYGLQGPGGTAMAGRLAGAPIPAGWSTLRVPQAREPAEQIRVYALDLGGGYRLMVGDDAESVEALDAVLLKRFVLAFLGVTLLGVAGGYGLSRGVHRRLSAITDTAQAIIAGDLSRRVPVRHSGDDLDRLAATLNRMLDRIEALMESLKQVSSDVAHDLRTPLTRLRQRLETAMSETAAARTQTQVEAALGDLDAILATFAALLRIAQIESGARRSAFRPVDLNAIARTVADAFAPSAEDQGATLCLESGEPGLIDGDAELLTQMLVNLVENALRHGGAGVSIRIRTGRESDRATLAVIDNGPGVPESERERIFDRFYRLEQSRSTPGSGLGLALAAAVARLHGATTTLGNAAPGLEVKVVFPLPSP